MSQKTSSIVDLQCEDGAEFLLSYGDLLVGTLTMRDCLWRFEYSDEFKQSDLRPLIGFPDVGKMYQSTVLWQFFAMRIPSFERPEVQEIIKREHLSEDDQVALLKRFGGRTIANPFTLKARLHFCMGII